MYYLFIALLAVAGLVAIFLGIVGVIDFMIRDAAFWNRCNNFYNR